MVIQFLMIVFVTSTTLASQLLIKHAVMAMSLKPAAPTGVSWLIAMFCSPQVLAAILLQGIGFGVWMIVVSKVKLGIAFSIQGATFYVMLALASWWIYGEQLQPWQWAGIGLVSAGVLLISLGGSA